MTDGGPKRRGVWAAALIACGLSFAHGGGPARFEADSFWLFAGAAFLALAGWLVRGPRGWSARILMALAVLMLSAGWYERRVHEIAPDCIERMLASEPRLLRVEGMVVDTPEIDRVRAGRLGVFFPTPPRTMFEVDADRAEGEPFAHGRLRVFASGVVRGVQAGDRARITGMARLVDSPRNPGELDRRAWARSHGVAGVIEVETPALVTRLEPVGGFAERAESWARRTLARVRSNAGEWLNPEAGELGSSLHQESSRGRSLLAALLLGQHERDITDVRDAFTRLGVAHLLAISGMNMVLLAAAVLWIVRAALPGGHRPRLEALIVALIVALYLLVIPVRAPVLRAALMVWALLATESTGRRYDRLNTLGWVMALTLAWQPLELFSAGFQLSFGIVAALLVLGQPARLKLFGPRPERDTHGTARAVLESSKDAAASALVAWLISTPIAAYHIGIFSPLGALATLILMPLVTMLMIAGYIVLVGSVIAPAIGHFAGPALVWCSDVVARIVLTIDAAPWTVLHLPQLSAAWAWLACGIICWWLWPTGIEGWSPRAALARWAATAFIAAWLSVQLFLPTFDTDNVLRIDTLDVGDGACHLVRSVHPETGRIEAALFDCGSMRLTIGERAIPGAVRALGAWRVPTIVITHPNIDHYAGVPDVVQPLGVRRVIVGEAFARAAEQYPAGPAAFTLDELRRRGVEVRTVSAGERWSLGSASVEVLSPPAGAAWKTDNDASLVSLIEVATNDGVRRTLMTGDIQQHAIVALMQDRPDLRADVLEVPHHGSAIEASFEFVRMVSPSVALQSTGRQRMNDPRWDAVKAATAGGGRGWWITARDGAMTTTISRDGGVWGSGYGVRGTGAKQNPEP